MEPTPEVPEASAPSQVVTEFNPNPPETSEASPDTKIGTDFSIFDIARNNTPTNESQAIEEQVEEVPKDEVTTEETSTETTGTVQPVSPKVVRDYSQFDAQDIPVLKRLPNAAFDRFKAILAENKELKAKPPVVKNEGLPDSYWTHPEAYRLDPNYGKAEYTYGLSQKIAEHWKRQEINIAKNGKVRNISLENGELVVGPEMAANEETAVQVDRLLSDARDQLSDQRRVVNNIRDGYKNNFESAVNRLREDEEKFFPGLGDPKHPTAKLQSQIIEALPPQLRNNPLVSTLAKTGAHNALLMQRINVLEAQLKATKGTKVDAAAAPPRRGNFVAAPSKTTAVDYDIFDKARQGK